jgi:hypothetical protein
MSETLLLKLADIIKQLGRLLLSVRGKGYLIETPRIPLTETNGPSREQIVEANAHSVPSLQRVAA